MKSTRRAFLRGAGAFALAAATPSGARAAGPLTTRNVPTFGAPFRVLEIFFAGALSHRESLWVEQPNERPVFRALDGYNPSTDPILTAGAPADWLAWLPGASAHTALGYRVGTAGTRNIHLGPAFEPFTRSIAGAAALKGRLRVVATGHDLPVHEPAQAYMMQGMPARTSAARASGVAAPIGRTSGLPTFVFYHSGKWDPTHSAEVAAATGRHGSDYAPMLVPYDDPSLVGLLGTARDPQRDAFVGVYRDAYGDRLTFAAAPATGTLARAVAFERYRTALDAALDAPAYAAAMAGLSSSSAETLWDNGTRRAVQTAASLLTNGLSRYCCVVDGGVVGDDDPSFYDMHNVGTAARHASLVTGNVLNVVRTLAEEVSAGRLNLDTTLVVLSTEFGRSFAVSYGSDHCPAGFAVALLGGPVRAGRGAVVGDLPFSSGDNGQTREFASPAYAVGGVGPGPVTATDLRAAVLLAAGVHPLQPDVFDDGETNTGALGRDAAADALATHLFGV